MNKFLSMMAVALVAAVSFSACSDDDDPLQALSQPVILQSEQMNDNPITLTFAWDVVENAVSYTYSLDAVAGDSVANITKGSTKNLSVTIVANDKVVLDYDTEYRFTVKAIGQEGAFLNSAETTCTAKTSAAPLKLSMEVLSYRSGSFSVKPSNADMRYQTALIEYDKYGKYASDKEFIEGYEFGYYKQIAASRPWIPAPWTYWLDDNGQQGDYTFNSRSMQPGKKYIFYAWGYQIDDNDSENPVKVLTPLMKKVFTTPGWAATSKTTFKLAVGEQTLENGVVDVKVSVVPSNEKEHYLAVFIPAETVTDHTSVLNYLINLLPNMEKVGNIDEWHKQDAVKTGAQTISSNEVAIVSSNNVTPGKDYVVAVFGIDNTGCVITNVATEKFTSISAE